MAALYADAVVYWCEPTGSPCEVVVVTFGRPYDEVGCVGTVREVVRELQWEGKTIRWSYCDRSVGV